MSSQAIKPVHWIASSYKDYKSFPEDVQDIMGFALYQAQVGNMHLSAKPLKGFGGASVVELVESHDGDAYRAVYTVKFDSAIYVLHAFQKKSKTGIKTPQTDAELIKQRLKVAEEDHKARLKEANEQGKQ